MQHAFNTVVCGIWYNVLIRQGVTADTTVLETDMENNIIDQASSKNDAEFEKFVKY